MKRIFSVILSTMIIFALCFVLSGCTTKTAYTYDGAEDYLSGNATFDKAEVTAINIDWVSGSVNVEFVDDIECLSVEETSRYTILEEEALRYKLDNEGVLTIKSCTCGTSAAAFRWATPPRWNLTVSASPAAAWWW